MDFLRLHANEPLHPGVIGIVPNVPPADQRALFRAALKHIGPETLPTLSLRSDMQATGLPVLTTLYRNGVSEESSE